MTYEDLVLLRALLGIGCLLATESSSAGLTVGLGADGVNDGQPRGDRASMGRRLTCS